MPTPKYEWMAQIAKDLREIADYVFVTFNEEDEYKYIEKAETLVSAADELISLAGYIKERKR